MFPRGMQNSEVTYSQGRRGASGRQAAIQSEPPITDSDLLNELIQVPGLELTPKTKKKLTKALPVADQENKKQNARIVHLERQLRKLQEESTMINIVGSFAGRLTVFSSKSDFLLTKTILI